jgi:cytochrome c-type biogenesis protein CcsB
MNLLFFQAAFAVYLLGTLAYLAYGILFRELLRKLANGGIALGFTLQTLAILTRYGEAGHTPVTNLYESLSFFAWMIMGLLLLAAWRYNVKVLGVFLCPVALLLMVFSLALPKEIVPLAPALKSFWHPFHVTFAFLGDACFALAFCCGIMYLIQEHQIKSKRLGTLVRRLPSLQVLDDLSYRALAWGFPLLTLGIITGAVWAEYAWGRYWGWDPKETWSLITWLLYAALLHQRLTAGWRGRRAAIMAIVGFLAVLFTFLGVSFLLPGLHAYLQK